MEGIARRIRAGEVLVADGGMGTSLWKAGYGSGAPLEAAHLTRPDLVERITAAFVDAGSDLVQTNTFGAHPANLERHGLRDRAGEIVREAVRIARRAAGERAAVFLSVGPSARILRPYGDASPDEIAAGFAEVVDAGVAEGIDLIVVETMTDLEEAVLAVRVAKENAPGVPVAATMTFVETPRGFHTIMGAELGAAAARLLAEGADLVGSNCGNGAAVMVEIARAFRAATDAPLLVQSNAGIPVIEKDAAVYPETPGDFAAMAAGLLDAGVAILGGCCGTGPEHIRAIRAAVDARRAAP